MKRWAGWIMAMGLLTVCGTLCAQMTPEELGKESEEYCASTASTKPTIDMVKAKVDEACALVDKEGKASFDKFKGKSSPYIFAGTYIWINDMDGIMLMHPIKYKMDGSDLNNIKDAKGKRMFVEFIEKCKAKGSGWVDYMWPKPGEKAPSQKISYVKKAVCDGKEVVVGCGIYDVPPEEIARLTAE